MLEVISNIHSICIRFEINWVDQGAIFDPVGSLDINTNPVLSDSGATLKFEFCTLKNITHTDFQQKIWTPGILVAIRRSVKRLWNYNTSVKGSQKFLCVVDMREKTDFLSLLFFWLELFFDLSSDLMDQKMAGTKKICFDKKFLFSCPSTEQRNFWNPFCNFINFFQSF